MIACRDSLRAHVLNIVYQECNLCVTRTSGLFNDANQIFYLLYKYYNLFKYFLWK